VAAVVKLYILFPVQIFYPTDHNKIGVLVYCKAYEIISVFVLTICRDLLNYRMFSCCTTSRIISVRYMSVG